MHESKIEIPVSSTYDVVHWFSAKVIDSKRQMVERFYWGGLRWDLRLKYDWYFKYRAALLQVKYPRLEVQVTWGNEPAKGKTLEQIQQSRITSKRSQLTKYRNRLEKAKKSWLSVFPIEEDDGYKKAVEKIKQLETELKTLQNTQTCVKVE